MQPILKEELTTREKEVLTCILKGFNRKQIAAELCISETTVCTHLNNIYGKHRCIEGETTPMTIAKIMSYYTDPLRSAVELKLDTAKKDLQEKENFLKKLNNSKKLFLLPHEEKKAKQELEDFKRLQVKIETYQELLA